ncbi:MAG TPA: hypothetical protein VEC57_20125 [Candidatus Limnocylindrales bacterium]|nr:hypothetical protein [Candidatus Limnocylindrales bacterium]
MDEGQDYDWRPTNLREGADRRYAWAEKRIRTASIVGGAWGTLLLAIGAYQFMGGLGIAPFEWNVVGGIAALLFALGAASRNLPACGALALLCVGELPALATSLGEVLAEGGVLDQALAGMRCAALPAVLYNGTQGYAGAFEYQKLRRPHSEPTLRALNPALLQGAILSSLALLMMGFMFGWGTRIMEGFSQPGAPVLNADGSLDAGSRLSKHLQDNAVNVETFQQRSGEEERAEAEERRKAREEAANEKAERDAARREAQWKVEEKENRYQEEGASSDPGGAGSHKPPRQKLELKGPAYATAQEGIEFAGKTDEAGCLTESLRRHEACKDEECRDLAGVFITSCLPDSKPAKGFCTGVPSIHSVVETTAWRSRLCASSGAPAGACHAFYANLQTYCHPDDAAKAAAGKNP